MWPLWGNRLRTGNGKGEIQGFFDYGGKSAAFAQNDGIYFYDDMELYDGIEFYLSIGVAV
jgi:hypothetical protein